MCILSYYLCSFESLVVLIKLLIVGSFGTVSLFFKWKHSISKYKSDILEILILLFDFRTLMLNFCKTIFHTQNLLHLFSLSNFWITNILF